MRDIRFMLWKEIAVSYLQDTPWLQQEFKEAKNRIEAERVIKKYIHYHNSFVDNAKTILQNINTF